MLANYLDNLEIIVPSGATNMVPVWCGDGTGDFFLHDSYISCPGPSIFQLDGSCYNLSIRDLLVEANIPDFMYISASASVAGLTLQNVKTAVQTRSGIYADDGSTIRGLVIDNCFFAKSYLRFYDLLEAQINRWWVYSEGEGTGIEVAHELDYSEVWAQRAGITITYLDFQNKITYFHGQDDRYKSTYSLGDLVLNGNYGAGCLVIGSNYLWFDGTGKLRCKSSAPTGETDGTIVGTQS